MQPEVIDFGLIRSQDTPQVTGLPTTAKYDTSFANWLIANTGLSPNEAKNTAYRIKHLSQDSMPSSKEDAAKLGLRVMLDETKAKSTKYGYLYAIERWMAYIGLPVKFAHKPRATARCPVFLNQAQLNQLIRASRDYKEYAILATFIFTGARCNEVRMLDVGDVDFAQRLIHIRHAKRDKERYVPLDPSLERVLRAYLSRFPTGQTASDCPLFKGNDQGGRIARENLSRTVKKIAERAGLEGVHPHVLRHSFATAWVDNGGDIFTLQKVLGHADIRMTLRYWHYNQSAAIKAWGKAAPKL